MGPTQERVWNSAREAVRLGGGTWRLVPVLAGDPCADCGWCDLGIGGHDTHECRLSPGWFCGSVALCMRCFGRRIQEEAASTTTTGVEIKGKSAVRSRRR